jgi:LmbE family N-acetylglucosaminyl deacetylase
MTDTFVPAPRLLPPGTTTRPSARRVLVLAPHYDDEVLGCGGLVAQLADAGARVRVLFLTDGGLRPPGSPGPDGAEEAGEPAGAYAARRRAESAGALEALGVAEAGHLELPDGRLAAHLDELALRLREAVLELSPDLLLVPSPLEVTADHRAAFAAVHRLLGPLRAGDAGALAAAVAELEVLLYEVNQPAYPDLLVDVSREVARIEAAMAAYASQGERHDYLAAGLGLRRFRTLSLPRGITAAEGYRRLRPLDFASRSPSALIRHLGGVPELLAVHAGPPVSVIVRTRDRPALLSEALASLAEGTYRNVEVVLVNDGGALPELPAGYPFPVRRVDFPENRGRAAAANAGVEAATGAWIAFLDDDDVAAPEHLAALAAAAEGAGVRAVYGDAAVITLELAAHGEPGLPGGWREVERRLPYSRDFDPDLLLLDNYVPFNTVLLERGLVAEVAAAAGGGGPFDPGLPFFEDWDFLLRLARRAPLHHVRRATCEYRHYRGAGHHALGERPRERADFLAVKARVLAKHAEHLRPETIARAVDTLRAEAVELSEAARHARDELADLRRAHATLDDRYHRLHGEVGTLRAEHERLRAEGAGLRDELERASGELRRLHDRESELAGRLEAESEHLGRTYAEIERLGGLLRTLETASLPGIVRWWLQDRPRHQEEG